MLKIHPCLLVTVGLTVLPVASAGASTQPTTLTGGRQADLAEVLPKDTWTTFHDSKGTYELPIPPGWAVQTSGDVLRLTSPEGGIRVFVVTVEGGDARSAADKAWTLADPSIKPRQVSVTESASSGGQVDLLSIRYDGESTRVLAATVHQFRTAHHVVLLDAHVEVLTRRDSQVGTVTNGLVLRGVPRLNLAAVRPDRWTDMHSRQLSTYVEDARVAANVPGAAVAVVQNGKIVYAQAFGVKQQDRPERVRVDTQFMIGSSGKTMTTAFMAALVDAGRFTWDTPVKDIFPSFKLKDPALSGRVTMRHLVCACTGVPRKDFEIVLNANTLKPNDIIEALGSFELFSKFGEAFQYSNHMVGTGGYVAALSDGARPDQLLQGYQQRIKARLFDPVGMPNTTIAVSHVLARGNYARPHGLTFDGRYRPIPLSDEAVLAPVAPAGTHWSTVLDAGKYLLMQLGRGRLPDGTRVVSASSLEETWKPQVRLSATSEYALGWMVDDLYGLRLVHHGGNTLGYSANLSFLPDKGVGVVVLSNGRTTNAFLKAVRSRTLELILKGMPAHDAVFRAELKATSAAGSAMAPSPVTLNDVQSTSGTYRNVALGDAKLGWVDGKFKVDFGEFSAELRAVNGQLVAYDSALAGVGVAVRKDLQGRPQFVLRAIPGVLDEYVFTKIR